MKDMLKKVFKHWEMFLVIFLILEFVVFGAANPKFLRPQSIMNSIVNYISVCIISLFVTMVMITGGIDIQAPAIIGLSSIIIGVLWSDAGLNIWAAVAIAVVVAALCGALSGFFVAYCGVQPMVVTLGGSFLYSGIALMVSGMSATPAYQGIGGFPAKNEAGKFVGFRFLGKGSIIGTVLASLIICILRYGLPLCFGVSTQNLDLPIGLILVVVVLGREIAGQHMLSRLFKRKKG